MCKSYISQRSTYVELRNSSWEDLHPVLVVAMSCRDPGQIVWTNAQNNTDHLQAVSMQGPVSVIINSTSGSDGVQNFLVQPYGALSDTSLTGSYANISMLGKPRSANGPYM